jgi:hypothetical protein
MPVHKITLFILLLIYTKFSFGIDPPATPTFIEPSITAVKIYDVNTVNETYKVDGYFSLTWNDPRVLSLLSGNDKAVFNGKSNTLDTANIWLPTIEFINVLGQRQVLNYRVTILENGTVEYFERFNGVFTTSMDFKKFPFDQQDFKLEIESFGYKKSNLQFTKGSSYIIKDYKSEFWKFKDCDTDTLTYSWTFGTKSIESENSRWIANYTMKRVPGYFYWQFYFPLALIIISALFTFWIADFGDRLNTTLSLLIAVIAFNFFTSTLLPELPYTTFIESGIIIGYGVIFSSIIFTVFIEWSKKGRHMKLARFLNVHLRWIIPVLFVFTLIMTIKHYDIHRLN